MSIRSRVRALERQRQRQALAACPRCRHAFPPEEHPATLPLLPPFEELRQLPYAELLRLYQERNRLDGTPAARCPNCGGRVPLPDSAEDLAAQQAEYMRLRKLPFDELVKLHREALGLLLDARAEVRQAQRVGLHGPRSGPSGGTAGRGPAHAPAAQPTTNAGELFGTPR